VKEVMVLNANGLQQGKRVLVLAATRADTYKARDGTWKGAVDLKHGDAVAAVNHVGRHNFEVADELHVHAMEGESADVKITGIKLVETPRLTEADFRAIGYDNRDAYMRDWGDVLGERVWFFHFQYLMEQPHG